ncbi:MAG: AMP-binding protein, partial [Planctomycetes bacterium]|nr:AMP-binding protein [Planctomycetota bacterium]
MVHATIWAILESAEQRFAGREAVLENSVENVVEGAIRRDYGEFAQRVRARARGWRALGVGPGDRVAILDWNSGAYLESYFAAAGLGAILTPLNHRLAVPELHEILCDSGAKLV